MADELKDYHVRPWTEPYLPEPPGRRDAVMLFGAIFIIDAVSITLAWFEQAVFAVALMSIGNAHFAVHYYSRAMERWRKRRGK